MIHFLLVEPICTQRASGAPWSSWSANHESRSLPAARLAHNQFQPMTEFHEHDGEIRNPLGSRWQRVHAHQNTTPHTGRGPATSGSREGTDG